MIPVPVSSTDETLQRVASIFPPPMSGTLLPCLRLDTTISPANTRPNPYREEVVLGDLLPSPDSPDPAALAEARAVSDAIDEVLATLDARSRAVIELRFGFAGPPLTLEQVGLRFDVTRERIRQVERKALKAIAPRLAAVLGMPLPGRAAATPDGAGPGPGALPRTPHSQHRPPAVPVPAASVPRSGPPVAPSLAQADRPPAAPLFRPGPPPPLVSLRLPPAPSPRPAAAPAPASAEDRIFRALLDPWQHVPPPGLRRPAVRPPETPPPPPVPPPARLTESPGPAAGLPLDAWLADWQARGFTVVDDRARGGSVWVRDAGMTLAAEIEHLRREGTWFRFAENRSAGAWGWSLVSPS